MTLSDLKTMTLEEVRGAEITTAVLPLGATEPHQLHLPYGTDIYEAEYVALGATRFANDRGGKCICLPCLPFGYDGNMKEFPLAINLQPSTLTRVVRDVALSLVGSGIDFLFILNGHGGNELKSMIRELNRDVDLFICGTLWCDCFGDLRAEICTASAGDHADEVETSCCLHIIPELVRMERAGEGHMSEPKIEEFKQGWIQYSRPWKWFAPSSGAGDPRAANAEAGKKLLEAAIERIGTFLKKLSTSERTPGFPFA